MAFATLAEADQHLVDLLPETDTGGVLASTSQRYRAISAVVNRIAWVTGVNAKEDDLAITQSTTEYDLGAGGAGPADDLFDRYRVLDIRIDQYPVLVRGRDEDDVRDAIRAGATGRPRNFWFTLPRVVIVAPIPDQAYTAKIRWVPPITIEPAEGSPSTVTLPIPPDWLFEGLDLGAWNYLTRARQRFETSENTRQQFELFLARLATRNPGGAISGSRAPADPLL